MLGFVRFIAPKADMCGALADVRFVPEADIQPANCDVLNR
jgi:hypothetical protein